MNINIIHLSGFGDSKAGELLKKIPELQDMFTIVSKVGEGKACYITNLLSSNGGRSEVSDLGDGKDRGGGGGGFIECAWSVPLSGI